MTSNSIQTLISRIQKSDPADRAAFHERIAEAVGVFGLTDEEVARMLGISRPTLNRWRNGVTSPRPLVVEIVYDKLLKEAQRRARLSERRVVSGISSARTPVPMVAKGRY